MKLASVRAGGQKDLAVDTEDGMVLLSSLAIKGSEGGRITLHKLMSKPYLLEQIDSALCEQSEKIHYLSKDEIRYEPATGKPEKIICLGHNYREHIKELGRELPETPIIFSKFNNTIAAADEDIPLPNCSDMIDYEGELGIVIGKTAENVTEEEALDYVFGYFVANDVSARDLQFRTPQWLIGKTCEKFFPTGPFIVTADEIPDPQKLTLRTTVNGELRQNSNTSDMIFTCRKIISYVSGLMTLKPGDVISTGTPQGVIAGMPEGKRQWLKNGDVVEIEIEGLGTLRNTFVK